MCVLSKRTKTKKFVVWLIGKVLGATDPETAAEGVFVCLFVCLFYGDDEDYFVFAGSVRREILNRWQEFGLQSRPDVGDNGVHASASPFEALAEVKRMSL